jgi:hypothetical protein
MLLKNVIVWLALKSSSVNAATLAFKSSIYLSFGSSPLTGLFEMYEALEAYVKVERFSSICKSHGFRHAIIKQKLLPPSD